LVFNVLPYSKIGGWGEMESSYSMFPALGYRCTVSMLLVTGVSGTMNKCDINQQQATYPDSCTNTPPPGAFLPFKLGYINISYLLCTGS